MLCGALLPNRTSAAREKKNSSRLLGVRTNQKRPWRTDAIAIGDGRTSIGAAGEVRLGYASSGHVDAQWRQSERRRGTFARAIIIIIFIIIGRNGFKSGERTSRRCRLSGLRWRRSSRAAGCLICTEHKADGAVILNALWCQAGHLVCNQCRQKLSCCPTCRGPLTPSIRNLAMEKVASTIPFPCKYASAGCLLSLHHTEKPEHEEVCEFRPYTCPCPGASCKWQGSLEAVMPHLMHAHKSITTLQGEDIVFLATDINLPGAVDWVMMQSCFGHHFMLVLEKQEKYEGHQQFFAIVLLIGTRKQAENFAYRLELNGNRRRLTWEATPRSIHDGVAAAIMNSDCLVFDTSIAHLFADHGNLGINVTISMC
uniref:E3 ubiquitin-protein ligase n=1 Tax=Callorhinchus milii TaxID=7868 RepID=A0A4W3GYD9_CALMI